MFSPDLNQDLYHSQDVIVRDFYSHINFQYRCGLIITTTSDMGFNLICPLRELLICKKEDTENFSNNAVPIFVTKERVYKVELQL